MKEDGEEEDHNQNEDEILDHYGFEFEGDVETQSSSVHKVDVAAVKQPKEDPESSIIDSSSFNAKKEHQKQHRAGIMQVFQFGDGPKKWCGLLLGMFCAAISGCVYPFMAFLLSNTFQVLSVPTSDEFRENIRELSFAFMIIGAVAFCSVAMQIVLLETAAEEVCTIK